MNGIAAPIAGVASIASWPAGSLADVSEGMLVAFGVPADSAHPLRPGCSAGPLVLREATINVLAPWRDSPSRTAVDLDAGNATRLRDDACGIDLGDIPAAGAITRSDIAHGTGLVTAIAARGGVPLLLGGDARVAECLLRGLDAGRALAGVIVISDRIVLPAGQDCDAVPVMDLVPGADVLWIGANGLQPRAAWDAACAGAVTAEVIHAEGTVSAREAISAFATRKGSIAIILDIGVVDTGHAAGTPGLNIGGLAPAQLTALLRGAVPAGALTGLAVTNVAPGLDARGHTENAGAEALIAALESRLFDGVPEWTN